MQNETKIPYQKYILAVRNEVERRTGLQVGIQRIKKNNGLELDGLTILEEGMNVSPTIYLNGFFEEYLEKGVHAVAEKIIAVYERNKPKQPLDISFFTDMKKVGPKIKWKIINYQKNGNLLKEVPHVKFLDLAVVFIVVLESGHEEGVATILIHHHHLGFWGMSTEELYNLALENTVNDYEIIPMSDIVQEIMDVGSVGNFLAGERMEMSVLSSYSKLHGASGMLHSSILKRYMRENQVEKLVIIPSSIHEVLLIPCNELPEMAGLSDMVKDVNATQLLPEEILSDNVYVYDGSKIINWG